MDATLEKAIAREKEYNMIKDIASKAYELVSFVFPFLPPWVVERRVNTLIKVCKKVEEKLNASGLSKKQKRYCSLKLGIPWVENASLEEDETLQNLWAVLLVNASNADFKEEIRVAYIDIIKVLSPLDVRIMEFMWPQKLFPLPTTTNERFQICKALGADWDDIEVGLDNLRRLQLIASPHRADMMPVVGEGDLRFTPLGYAFLRACVASTRS